MDKIKFESELQSKEDKKKIEFEKLNEIKAQDLLELKQECDGILFEINPIRHYHVKYSTFYIS